MAGCASGPPVEPPPLRDMEEPLALFDEPDDEVERQALPTGGFTGIYVTDSGDSLESLIDETPGVLVDRVVENSPGHAAGIEPGDLLLAARIPPDAPDASGLSWASQWRAIELDAGAGEELRIVYDRAGVERRATLTVAERVHPPERQSGERYREEDRVGVVVRTATEVEARAVGLGPGGGAVIVGLSQASPWRSAGLRYGDLITAIDERPIDHPQVVLDVIRAGDPAKPLVVVFTRDGASRELPALLTSRATETTLVDIPLIYTYERDRDREEVSILLGIYHNVKTPAAWRTRILWIFSFGGGDADRLRDVSQ
jgi:C-terminal processing protease CtpA/Prc